MKKLHSTTVKTLKTLKDIELQIRALNEERRRVLAACEHLDYEPELVETLAFDWTPRRICVICRHEVRGITDKEKKELWRKHYHDLEMDLPEDWEKHKDGLNLR